MDSRKVLFLISPTNTVFPFSGLLVKQGFQAWSFQDVSRLVHELRQGNILAIVIQTSDLQGDERYAYLRRCNHPGLELLKALLDPESTAFKLTPPITFDPLRVIVLTDLVDQIGLGIPHEQIMTKDHATPETILRLVQKMTT